MPVLTAAGKPVGYQKVTGLSAATALTVPADANSAILVAASQGVALRDDGTNPSATDGYPIAAGVHFQIDGRAALLAAKFIELASSATLHVLYYAS